MPHILIKNAREHNLQVNELAVPLHSLVLFSGPSGSGKSSLAVDTILREGQRRCFEALRASFPIQMNTPPHPRVDSIDNLPPTFGLRQDVGISYDTYTTIGSLVGILPLLEQLFVQFGRVHCPITDLVLPAFTAAKAVEHLLKHHQGKRALLLSPLQYTRSNYTQVVQEVRTAGFSRLYCDGDVCFVEDAPSSPPNEIYVVLDRLRLSEKNKQRCLEATHLAYKKRHLCVAVEQTLYTYASRPFSKALQDFLPVPTIDLLRRKNKLGACPECLGTGGSPSMVCKKCTGTGLSQHSSILKIDAVSYQNILQYRLVDVLKWASHLEIPSPILPELMRRVQLLNQLNLSQLSLSRKINTLSTGERSRTRLASVLVNRMGRALYILDEPSLGLGNDDVFRVIDVIRRLITDGQSFIVVDHHPIFLQQCDHNFYFGPGSGKKGGQIVPAPTLPSSLVGQPKLFATQIRVDQFTLLNGGINLITGPSGVGKSRLLQTLRTRLSVQFEATHTLDSVGSSGNKRSCVATISGVWSPIRSLYAQTKEAKILGLTASHFSFNRSGGRCETCGGLGVVPILLPPLPPSEERCPDCGGARFNEVTLQVRYRRNNLSDLLNSSISTALQLFEAHPVLYRSLYALNSVGVGYLSLGQSTTSLSGGENRRIKFAGILEKSQHLEADMNNTLFVFDDPTAALHMQDAITIQQCLLDLRRAGATLLIATQNRQMLDIADQIIELPVSLR